ncbi:hypothetical protein GCM10010913_48990 [Paenibacillus aceti]|uniref:Transposase DDE domain-containing protein n=1 Tax=Paenibacillus aceti TaxID=1820010 RepID=A0ABQ1WAF4_9BACL|nr:hypothetical protein GCM10010913_48990 [Paenibacillus aceti]
MNEATGSFEANEIDLLVKLLAYNLYERFKRECCEPVHRGYTIARFRLEFFHCAGTLVKHSRRITLKLAKNFAHHHTWNPMTSQVLLSRMSDPNIYMEKLMSILMG